MSDKVKEVEITPRHRPQEYVKAWILGVAGAMVFLLVLSLLSAALFQHPTSFLDYISIVGHDWLIVIFLILGAILFLVLCIGIWRVSRGQFIPMEQSGGYWRRGIMKDSFKPLKPLSPPQSPAQSTTHTEISEEQSIPRLGDIIRKGELLKKDNDQMLMFQGVRADGTYRYGPWPGVIAIVGMQNVGKTITMVLLIVAAILQGAKVVICDTHHAKARSLYKKVLSLQGFVSFATTEEEVLIETQEFSQELASRKCGSEPRPYIIFYDELCSLIRTQNEELRILLPTVMEEASQEGHGYNMHMVSAIHDMSNRGIGDARLRSFWNLVYCHRIEAGQSKFIEAFKGRYDNQKISILLAGLPAGHAMIRDEYNEVEYLILPYADSRDVLLAAKSLRVTGLAIQETTAQALPPPDTLYTMPPLQPRQQSSQNGRSNSYA